MALGCHQLLVLQGYPVRGDAQFFTFSEQGLAKVDTLWAVLHARPRITNFFGDMA